MDHRAEDAKRTDVLGHGVGEGGAAGGDGTPIYVELEELFQKLQARADGA